MVVSLSPILAVLQLYRGVQYICTLITTRNIQAVINKLEFQLCIVNFNCVLWISTVYCDRKHGFKEIYNYWYTYRTKVIEQNEYFFGKSSGITPDKVWNRTNPAFYGLALCIHTFERVRVMMFNATFNNISVISWCRSVLLVKETGELGENHRPATPLFSNFLFTNLFSITFLYFFIISSLFPYFNLFVSIFKPGSSFSVDMACRA
jgi:hypothetical protein